MFTYTYDAVGNRKTQTILTTTTTHTYDNANRLITATTFQRIIQAEKRMTAANIRFRVAASYPLKAKNAVELTTPPIARLRLPKAE